MIADADGVKGTSSVRVTVVDPFAPPQGMTTTRKIVLGLATLSQWIGVAAFAFAVFYLFSTAPPNAPIEYFERSAGRFNLAGFFFILYCTAILIVFILHAARNQNLERSGMRTTWLLLLVLLGLWAEPFYWFFHIWRDGTPILTPSSGPLGLE